MMAISDGRNLQKCVVCDGVWEVGVYMLSLIALSIIVFDIHVFIQTDIAISTRLLMRRIYILYGVGDKSRRILFRYLYTVY